MGSDGVFAKMARWLRASPEERLAHKQREAALDQALDAVLADHYQVHSVGGHKRKLSPAVQQAYDYTCQMVEHIPGPVEIHPDSWDRDPLINALFIKSEDLLRLFEISPELKKCCQMATGERVCALMTMDKKERSHLGTKVQGNLLRRDILQVAVSFYEHRIIAPHPTVEGVRDELQRRCMGVLAQLARQKVTAVEENLDQLETLLNLLRVKEKSLRGRKKNLHPGMEGFSEVSAELASVQDELQRAEERQARTQDALAGPEDYLAVLAEVMSNPQDYLRIKTITMLLNTFGIKVDDDSPDEGNELTVAEMDMGPELQRHAVLVRFDRHELLAGSGRAAGAATK